MKTNDWLKAGQLAGPCLRPGGIDLTERALGLCDLPAGSLVADIGCGAGATLAHLARAGRYRLVGLELSQSQAGLAAAGLVPAGLVCGRAEALPFRAGIFDALLCECVLSILDEPAAALGEFARVLTDRGLLVVSDVFAKGDGDRRRPAAPLFRRELLRQLAGLGFAVIHWESHDRRLGEFAARMILAGAWDYCRPKTETRDLGYFLLVAGKTPVTAPLAGYRDE